MKFAGDLHACTVHAFVLLNKKEKLRNLQHSARADEPYEVYNILWICLQSMCRTRLNSLSNETTVTCENIVFTARIVAGTWYMAIGGGRDAVARKYVTKPFFLHTFWVLRFNFHSSAVHARHEKRCERSCTQENVLRCRMGRRFQIAWWQTTLPWTP